MTRNVLLTGANRGLGLGLAKAFLAKGYDVHATARHPDHARDLWELEADYKGRCHLHTLDVTSDGELQTLGEKLAGNPIHVLVNNAGVLPSWSSSFVDLNKKDLIKAFEVNTVAPIRVTQTFLPHLKEAGRPIVATLSSLMGSIYDNTSGGAYAYRISKTAVNMWNKSFAIDHPWLTAVVLHPGWVKTDMGGANAPTEIEASVAGLMQVLGGLKPEDSGHFIDFKGRNIPW
jgi:NAD(P)-dependent dehydrogenase (short-subunit alcohol dehydrogenase family)